MSGPNANGLPCAVALCIFEETYQRLAGPRTPRGQSLSNILQLYRELITPLVSSLVPRPGASHHAPARPRHWRRKPFAADRAAEWLLRVWGRADGEAAEMACKHRMQTRMLAWLWGVGIGDVVLEHGICPRAHT